MTKYEKNKMLLKLFSLYEKSPYGEVSLEEIENTKEVYQKLMFLYHEGFIIFEHKPITNEKGEITEVRIRGGIRFTEKGFDYLKELRRSKFVKFWEILYKVITPITVFIDLLIKIVNWLLKR
ncbi:MAG: hypothetical protein ACP5QX_05085 [Caldisericaceae bacterium]